MKKAVAVMPCLLFPLVAIAADSEYKVTYNGGSIPVKAGHDLHISMDSTNIHVFDGKTEVATIPAALLKSATAKTCIVVLEPPSVWRLSPSASAL